MDRPPDHGGRSVRLRRRARVVLSDSVSAAPRNLTIGEQVRAAHAAQVAALTDADLRADHTHNIIGPTLDELKSVSGRGATSQLVTHLNPHVYGPAVADWEFMDWGAV